MGERDLGNWIFDITSNLFRGYENRSESYLFKSQAIQPYLEEVEN
ncbi:MAG: hypothetical protein ACK4F9_04850 [Brevinematia bacterium]